MRAIDRLLDTQVTYGKVRFRIVDLIFAAVMLALGLVFRLYLYDILSGDYTMFLENWMRECREAGGFAYLGITPGESDASTINYNVMYQYVIVMLNALSNGENEMYLIKTVSVIFDIVCGVAASRIAYHVTGQDIRKAVFAFGCVMLLPTSALNSGAWSQNDSMYGAFLLLSFLHFMKGDSNRGFIYFAVSYIFKQ